MAHAPPKRAARCPAAIRPVLVRAALSVAMLSLWGAGAALAGGSAPTPTATPCDSSGARLELHLTADPAAPVVGYVVDVAVQVTNPSGGLAGLPSYSLFGAEPLFAVELVESSQPLARFARYRLTALQAGRTELRAAVYYETSHRCFGFDTFFFRSSSSDPFPIEVRPSGPPPTPTATSLEPAATPTLTPTFTPATIPPPPCAGDCDGDGEVAVHEVVTAVGIALGEIELAECSAADADGSSIVTVDELIRALLRALSACGAA
jgi:hypothetical protein